MSHYTLSNQKFLELRELHENTPLMVWDESLCDVAQEKVENSSKLNFKKPLCANLSYLFCFQKMLKSTISWPKRV